MKNMKTNAHVIHISAHDLQCSVPGTGAVAKSGQREHSFYHDDWMHTALAALVK